MKWCLFCYFFHLFERHGKAVAWNVCVARSLFSWWTGDRMAEGHGGEAPRRHHRHWTAKGVRDVMCRFALAPLEFRKLMPLFFRIIMCFCVWVLNFSASSMLFTLNSFRVTPHLGIQHRDLLCHSGQSFHVHKEGRLSACRRSEAGPVGVFGLSLLLLLLFSALPMKHARMLQQQTTVTPQQLRTTTIVLFIFSPQLFS